jgi:hypothetical protein
MNWDAIGAIGQAIGAFVLIAVFVQVRHARNEMRRSILEERYNAGRELYLARSSNERLLQIRSKANATLLNVPMPILQALMDKAGLTFAEAETVLWDQIAWWTHVKTGIAFMDETPSDRSWFEAGIRALYSREALGRFWYQHMKDTELDPDTVKYVDSVIARPG